MSDTGGCVTPGQILDLLRKRLNAEGHELVEAHVVVCDQCAREYLALEELEKRGDEASLKQVLSETPAPQPPDYEELFNMYPHMAPPCWVPKSERWRILEEGDFNEYG